MDLWQLHIFCKVVEMRSFSKAGKAAHLSQPTVSSHIKDLEAHFGCRLIDRLAKEAVPTRAGELLYEYARRLLALKNETEAALAEFQGKITGKLLIGGSSIPGVYLLPRVMGAFMKIYPEMTLSIAIGDTEKIVHDTVGGLLELGVVGARSKHPQVLQETLIEDQMCLAAPAGIFGPETDRITVAELCALPFVIREQGSGTLQSFQKSLLQHGRSVEDLNVVAEMGSTTAVIQCIKSGVGVSIVSRIAVAEELAAGSLRILSVTGLDLRRNFYLTTHKYRSPSPLSKAFIRFLKKSLKEFPAF